MLWGRHLPGRSCNLPIFKKDTSRLEGAELEARLEFFECDPGAVQVSFPVADIRPDHSDSYQNAD